MYDDYHTKPTLFSCICMIVSYIYTSCEQFCERITGNRNE